MRLIALDVYFVLLQNEVPQSVPDKQQKPLSVPQTSDVEAVGDEIFDAECLKLMNEYFYGKSYH